MKVIGRIVIQERPIKSGWASRFTHPAHLVSTTNGRFVWLDDKNKQVSEVFSFNPWIDPVSYLPRPYVEVSRPLGL